MTIIIIIIIIVKEKEKEEEKRKRICYQYFSQRFTILLSPQKKKKFQTLV